MPKSILPKKTLSVFLNQIQVLTKTTKNHLKFHENSTFDSDSYRKKNMGNRITSLFKIDYPIIQAGMIWCSGWELASAVSNAGGLGIIGSGSMYPEVLEEHVQKCKAATDKPFAVNLPMLYPDIDKHLSLIHI